MTLTKLLYCMRDFQRKNNIKNKCVTNAVYLYDCMRVSMDAINDISIKAMIVVSGNHKSPTFTICSGHLVVVVNGNIIDPSYDIFSLKNKKYYDNIADCLNSVEGLSDTHIKLIIKRHIQFVAYEKPLNDEGALAIDETYYHQQADYVDKYLSKY